LSSSISFSDLSLAFRFACSIPLILRDPVGAEEALRVLRHRREHREDDFLKLALRSIYQNPQSPYLRLLKHAGCDFESLKKIVRREGLEGALDQLLRQGVYLTIDELKGREKVRRGSLEFSLSFRQLLNPATMPFLPVHTGGSTGPNTAFFTNRKYVRERTVIHFLTLRARKGLEWDQAIWGIPGHTDLLRVIELAGFGRPPKRWFSQVDPKSSELHPRYKWSAAVLTEAARLTGVGIPRPEYVPLSDPRPIVCWLKGVLDRGGIPHMTTFVTPALKICLSALDNGIDISGTQMTVGGEPLKESHIRLFRKTGCQVVPRFLAVECGYIAYGCLRPSTSDDLHFFNDMLAAIQACDLAAETGLTPKAILLTSLRPSAPIVLFNTSLGDEAELKERECGCELGKLGWTKHLSAARSLKRVTCGGMTVPIADIIAILERVLPVQFGGTAQDYQLVEREDESGALTLKLLVSPGVGLVDEREVLNTFLEALGSTSDALKVMSLQWKHSLVLSVERKPPLTTAVGKTLPFTRERG